MDVKHALILSGGKSRRMGQDKSTLVYKNVAQYKQIYSLVTKLFSHTYFSISKQTTNTNLLDYPHIVDITDTQCGPMLGILSALCHTKNVPWFVIAIDMPNITEKIIVKTLESRKKYIKTHNLTHAHLTKNTITKDGKKKNFFEPLFGIYESTIYNEMQKQFANKQYSLQKLLNNENIFVNQLEIDDLILKNINTSAEYKSYKAAL